MRWSFVGSIGWSGSVHSVIVPSPFVSSTAGHQPCDACSSPVSSNVRVLIHPTTLFIPL